MNTNDSKFVEPRRQSLVAIIMIIYKFYKVIVAQLWPFLIIFFVGSGRKSQASWEQYLLYAAIVFGSFSMLLAILNYFKFYYFIKDDELHVRKGVFKKQQISIPLERVQTVNFEENIFHRLFGVTSLKIDTAGSIKEEFNLDAIKINEAQEIRDFILSRKKELPSEGLNLDVDFSSEEDADKTDDLIIKLSLTDLVKIGVSYNHLRSAGLIIGGFFWLFYQLDDIFPDSMDEKDIIKTAIGTGLFLAIIMIVIFFLVSFVFSLVRSILKFYNLNFKRRGDGFKIISGLLTRQEFSALDSKIQQVGWQDNLIQKKLFGIFDFNLKQAGSVAINSKKSISIPGVNQTHIKSIVNYHFGNLDMDAFEFFPVEKKMVYRQWAFTVLFFIPAFILSLTSESWAISFQIILLMFFIIFSLWKKYKKTQYGISQDVLFLKGGTFGDETVLIKLHKVQAVQINQSPYQKRNDLATLKIFTASGTNKIPYIKLAEAKRLSDHLLLKVESSKKSWM